jgi:hypothetical protein
VCVFFFFFRSSASDGDFSSLFENLKRDAFHAHSLCSKPKLEYTDIVTALRDVAASAGAVDGPDSSSSECMAMLPAVLNTVCALIDAHVAVPHEAAVQKARAQLTAQFQELIAHGKDVVQARHKQRQTTLIEQLKSIASATSTLSTASRSVPAGFDDLELSEIFLRVEENLARAKTACSRLSISHMASTTCDLLHSGAALSVRVGEQLSRQDFRKALLVVAKVCAFLSVFWCVDVVCVCVVCVFVYMSTWCSQYVGVVFVHALLWLFFCVCLVLGSGLCLCICAW